MRHVVYMVPWQQISEVPCSFDVRCATLPILRSCEPCFATGNRLLQELHRQGHEIAAFSITTNEEEDYWLDGSYDDWLAEMAGARLIIERFAGISDGSVIGEEEKRIEDGGKPKVYSRY